MTQNKIKNYLDLHVLYYRLIIISRSKVQNYQKNEMQKLYDIKNNVLNTESQNKKMTRRD